MRFPRIGVRTLFLVVAVVAVVLELSMLGGWSRRYHGLAREAAEAERLNAAIVPNSKLAASQYSEQADRIAASDPAKAAELRARATRILDAIPFFEDQTRRATLARAAYERAATRPWEGAPREAQGLNSTAPVR